MEISTDFYSQSLFLFFVIKLVFLQLNVWIFPSFRLGFELTLQRPGGPYGPLWPKFQFPFKKGSSKNLLECCVYDSVDDKSLLSFIAKADEKRIRALKV